MAVTVMRAGTVILVLDVWDRMTPKSGNRFPAFAKPASAGEGRSDKVMV
jgi:hypothetical protein